MVAMKYTAYNIIYAIIMINDGAVAAAMSTVVEEAAIDALIVVIATTTATRMTVAKIIFAMFAIAVRTKKFWLVCKTSCSFCEMFLEIFVRNIKLLLRLL